MVEGITGTYLLLIVLGKSLAAFGIVLLLGYPLSSAFMVSAALAQIGEFSFILAGLGVAHQLLPPEGLSLIVAGSLLSISLNPLVFASTDLLIAWSRKIFWLRDRSELGRAASFTRLQEELEAARVAVQTKAAHHKSYRPEELAERFPLPGIKRLNVFEPAGQSQHTAASSCCCNEALQAGNV